MVIIVKPKMRINLVDNKVDGKDNELKKKTVYLLYIIIISTIVYNSQIHYN